MESSSAESRIDPSSIKIIHHEKGNSCVVFWSIEHFSTCIYDLMCLITSKFAVNIRSGIQWGLTMHFKTGEDESFIGVSLKAATAVPADLLVTCNVAVVENSGQLYDVMLCSNSIGKYSHDVFFPQLISKAFLSCNESRFLKNDTLKIRCELSIGTNQVSRRCFDSAGHYMKLRDENLITHLMNKLHKSRMYSNFTLNLENRKEKVHRSVLSARSPLFSSFFKSFYDSKTEVDMDMDKDSALALLTYVYTGNPYEIRCTPTRLNKIACGYSLPLLKNFTEPNTLALRSRITLRRKVLLLKIKNFYTQACNKRHLVSFDFDINDEHQSMWSVLMDFSAQDKIIYRVTKISSTKIPFNVQFQTFVLTPRKRYEFLHSMQMQSDNPMPRTFYSDVWAKSLKAETARFTTDNHLNLKIVAKMSSSIIEDRWLLFERSFSSEIVPAENTTPPDFARLREDVIKMYDSKHFSSFALISNTGDKFFVHKFMLGLHSPLLTHLLDNSPQLPHIRMVDVATSNMEIIVRYMYSGFLPNLTLNQAESLLIAAKKYKLLWLKDEVLHMLQKNLNATNSYLIFGIASKCKEEELKSSALAVVRSQHNPNLEPFPRASTSTEDNVTSPQPVKKSKQPVTSPQSVMKNKDSATSPQSTSQAQQAVTSNQPSHDEGIIFQPGVQSDYTVTNTRTVEEHLAAVKILQDIINLMDPVTDLFPGMKNQNTTELSEISTENLNPEKVYQDIMEHLDTLARSKLSQNTVMRPQLGEESEDATAHPGTGIEHLDSEKTYQALVEFRNTLISDESSEGAVTSPQLRKESEEDVANPRTGVERLDPVKLYKDLVEYLHSAENPEPEEDTIRGPQLGLESKCALADLKMEHVDSVIFIQPTAKSIDHISAQPGTKIQDTVLSTPLGLERDEVVISQASMEYQYEYSNSSRGPEPSLPQKHLVGGTEHQDLVENTESNLKDNNQEVRSDHDAGGLDAQPPSTEVSNPILRALLTIGRSDVAVSPPTVIEGNDPETTSGIKSQDQEESSGPDV